MEAGVTVLPRVIEVSSFMFTYLLYAMIHNGNVVDVFSFY